jgi:hypothetical protein
MRLLNNISDNPSQEFTLVGENGEQIPFLLYYMPSQQSWFFNISYNGITANGVKVAVNPNVLRFAKNYFPFGLAVWSNDTSAANEPYYLTDFANDRIRLYLLNQTDVKDVEQQLFGNVS